MNNNDYGDMRRKMEQEDKSVFQKVCSGCGCYTNPAEFMRTGVCEACSLVDDLGINGEEEYEDGTENE